ncbi:hypothetical protein F1D05_18190 [Kribbella qitaiheensis]|uniref:Uncharacterized protein n=1 Tax=Kribbella qitaiheensis TaxID=1544730 RepID=A0A7G6WZS3_9ACTN|nr:hypothetical protein [Kribbella qitaiheensis]QNE19488.1 hypothetical protein F1D05_18190 [Kribbella qitaiheensis]
MTKRRSAPNSTGWWQSIRSGRSVRRRCWNGARKGRRRRRLLSAAGVAGGIAVVAVSASLLPNLNGSAEPPASGPPNAATQPSTTPTARHPVFDDPQVDDATLLRGCTAKLATPNGGGSANVNLTGWRVVVRTTLPKIGTLLVAAAPDGKGFATCDLYRRSVPAGWGQSSTTHVWPKDFVPTVMSPNLLSSGLNCSTETGPRLCKGFLIVNADRVPKQVVKIHVDAKNGHTLDVPVKDGWYAVMWATGPNGLVAPAYRAYDAAGKLVPLHGQQVLDSVRFP